MNQRIVMIDAYNIQKSNNLDAKKWTKHDSHFFFNIKAWFTLLKMKVFHIYMEHIPLEPYHKNLKTSLESPTLLSLASQFPCPPKLQCSTRAIIGPSWRQSSHWFNHCSPQACTALTRLASLSSSNWSVSNIGLKNDHMILNEMQKPQKLSPIRGKTRLRCRAMLTRSVESVEKPRRSSDYLPTIWSP